MNDPPLFTVSVESFHLFDKNDGEKRTAQESITLTASQKEKVHGVVVFYKIVIRRRGIVVHTLYRRYSDFVNLHAELKLQLKRDHHHNPNLLLRENRENSGNVLPPKACLGKATSAAFLRRRMQGLHAYLQSALGLQSPVLKNFLDLGCDTSELQNVRIFFWVVSLRHMPQAHDPKKLLCTARIGQQSFCATHDEGDPYTYVFTVNRHLKARLLSGEAELRLTVESLDSSFQSGCMLYVGALGGGNPSGSGYTMEPLASQFAMDTWVELDDGVGEAHIAVWGEDEQVLKARTTRPPRLTDVINSAHPESSPPPVYDDYNFILADPMLWLEVRPFLMCRYRQQAKKWTRLLQENSDSSSSSSSNSSSTALIHSGKKWRCNDPELRNITYGGIPPAHVLSSLRDWPLQDDIRPQLWAQMSEAVTLQAEAPIAYASLCAIKDRKDWLREGMTDQAHFMLASLTFDQIEMDLGRTEETITDEEKAALRRILRAFSLRNPKVGYMQAMNFIGILLLRVCIDEEQAFWLLSILCEEIIPFYFAQQLVGVRVASRVIRLLLQRRLPRLHAHFEATSFPLELFLVQWLCSIFSSSFPAETCYRIWDALFLHGADTLLFVALAFLRGIEDDVLKAESMVATNLILRERAATCYDADALMESAFEERAINLESVDRLREENMDTVTESLDGSLRRRRALDLVKATPFQRNAIELLLEEILLFEPSSSSSASASPSSPTREASSRDAPSKGDAKTHRATNSNSTIEIKLDEAAFKHILTRILPAKEDRMMHATWNGAFDAFCDAETRVVDLQEFASVLAIFNATMETTEKLRLAFQCFDVNHEGKIFKGKIAKMLTASLLLFCAEISKEDVRGLVSKLLESFGSYEYVGFAVFQEKMRSTPVLCDLVV
eukprot:g3969.t1